MHCWGITLPGKIVEYGTIKSGCVEGIGIDSPQRLFSVWAKKSVVTPPANDEPAEKSPVRSASVGTATVSDEVPFRIRSPSKVRKKNVLFFLRGPPNVAPNWFCR